MELQLLISAVNADPAALIRKMNIRSDAVLVNQCGKVSYEELSTEGYTVRVFSFDEKGVGLSRNNALMRADKDICLFSDEDIVYTDDYRNTVDVPDTVAEDGYEEFWHYLVVEYGEDNAEEHDTAKEFADYYHEQLAA